MKKFYLENPKMYQIYENLMKSGFDINPDRFFIELFALSVSYTMFHSDPYKAYKFIVKSIENEHEEIEERIFYMNSFYDFFCLGESKSWKDEKLRSYLKNYENEVEWRDNMENLNKVVEYAENSLSKMEELSKNDKGMKGKWLKDLKNYVREYSISNQQSVKGTNDNIENQLYNKKTEHSQSFKEDTAEEQTSSISIKGLNLNELTQNQFALFIFYLQRGGYEKELNVIQVENKFKTKVETFEFICTKYQYSNSHLNFKNMYYLIIDQSIRTRRNQILNLKTVIEKLSKFPIAKNFAVGEHKLAEISKV